MIQGMGEIQNQPEAFLDLDADKIILFFSNFGLFAKVDYKPLPIRRLELIVQTARTWHGEKFAQYVMDCFIPTGIEYSHYEFDYPVELIPFED